MTVNKYLYELYSKQLLWPAAAKYDFNILHAADGVYNTHLQYVVCSKLFTKNKRLQFEF